METEPAVADTHEADEHPSVENPEVSAETQASTESKAEKTMTALEFTCNDDAKDYLEENFGVARSKLRTRADIVSAGKENGVDIHFDS